MVWFSGGSPSSVESHSLRRLGPESRPECKVFTEEADRTSVLGNGTGTRRTHMQDVNPHFPANLYSLFFSGQQTLVHTHSSECTGAARKRLEEKGTPCTYILYEWNKVISSGSQKVACTSKERLKLKQSGSSAETSCRLEAKHKWSSKMSCEHLNNGMYRNNLKRQIKK